MDILSLREKLEDCLEKNIPVLHVVAIVGTTEEGTVDNIEEILKVRKDFAKKGLYFHFHIDGAYGAYFCSLLKLQRQYWNSISPYTAKQLSLFDKADSITFDPHKTGYVPYSCGGIIYRNHRLRDNLNFSAPYIYTGTEPNMAIYGI
jgi:glutamate/tyrosine decarboxylase-like PLP-dependent enzyme